MNERELIHHPCLRQGLRGAADRGPHLSSKLESYLLPKYPENTVISAAIFLSGSRLLMQNFASWGPPEVMNN